MNSELIEKITHSSLNGLIIGALLTFIFSLIIEWRKQKMDYNIKLQNKKEEFYINLIDFLNLLLGEVLINSDCSNWSDIQSSKEINKKFNNINQMMFLYGNDRIRKSFSKLSCKLLSGILCTTELKYFYQLLGFELNISQKQSSLIRYTFFKLKTINYRKKIYKENKKLFLIKFIKILDKLKDSKSNDKKDFGSIKRNMEMLLTESESYFQYEFIYNIKNTLDKLEKIEDKQEIKTILDSLANDFFAKEIIESNGKKSFNNKK